MAHGLVATGWRRVLLMTGTPTPDHSPGDQRERAAVRQLRDASLIGPVEDGAGFICFEVGSDGAGHQLLIQPASGTRMPRSPGTAVASADRDGNVRSLENLFMDGRSIFIFGLGVVPKLVDRLLAKGGVRKDDVDLFVFHQANKFMIDSILKRSGIAAEKTYYALKDTGNSGGSTVVVALSEAWSAGRIAAGS